MSTRRPLATHRLPIRYDDRRFSDQTERMFREMQSRMDHDLGSGFVSLPVTANPQPWPHVTSWQGTNVNNQNTDNLFFKLNPRTTEQTVTITSSSGGGLQQSLPAADRGSREVLDDATVSNLFVPDSGNSRMFRISFDVKNYDPKDIQVHVEDDCLVVSAKHKEVRNGITLDKEFNRRIQLPNGVESDKLSSVLSSDGILSLQAPCPPQYQSLTAGGAKAPRSVSPVPIQQSPFTSTQLAADQQFQPIQQRSSPTITVQHVSDEPITSTKSVQNQSIQHQTSSQGSVATTHQGPVVISVMPYTVPATIAPDMPVFTTVDGGRRRLDLLVDMGRQYTAKDLVIKVDGRKLHIDATHEENKFGRVTRSTMSRTFDLSEDVNPSTVQAMMRDDGQLAIVAISPLK